MTATPVHTACLSAIAYWATNLRSDPQATLDRIAELCEQAGRILPAPVQEAVAAAVESVIVPAERLAAARATRQRTEGAEALLDARNAAVRKACDQYGDRWYFRPGMQWWITMPKGRRSFKLPMGTTMRVRQDMNCPPPSYWAGGVIPSILSPADQSANVSTDPRTLAEIRGETVQVETAQGDTEGETEAEAYELADAAD